MRIRALCTALCGSLLLLSVPAAAQAVPGPSAAAIAAQTAEQNAESLQLSREIVAIAFPTEQRQAIMHQMLETLTQQIQGAVGPQGSDAGLKAIFNRFMSSLPDRVMPVIDRHMPAIIDATAQAYSREFSLAEIREIRGFAGTDAGNHMLSRGTALLGDPAIAAVNRAYFRDLQDLNQSAAAELGREVEAYLQAHPEHK